MTASSHAGGTPTAGCPDPAVLSAIHRGTASSAEVETWADHIGYCVHCEATLQDLPPDIDPLFAVFAGLGAPTETHYSNTIRSPAPDKPALPREFGDYTLEAELGRGGMGIVFRARQHKPSRIVALKQLAGPVSLGSESVERFRTEYEAISRVRHPHITILYQSGWKDGIPWYAMELVGGGSLADRLREGPLAPKAAAELLKTAALAIEHAHQKGVIHRDLKPSNVLLTEDSQPKLADFGLAKLSDRTIEMTATEKIMGSPGFMAPEQATGGAKAAGTAADVYGLGAILYACLTSRPPFVGSSPAAVIAQTIHNDPAPPRRLVAGVPRDLETVCLKCLEKSPAKRYESARDVADDLQRFLEGRPIVARPVGPADRLWRWCKREPRLAAVGAVAAALLIALLGTGYWFLRNSDRQEIDVANARREADLNDAKRTQAEQARAVEVYYRSLQECDARSQRREPGWSWENRQAIANAAASGLDVPDRLAELRTYYVKQTGIPDFRPLPPFAPSILTAAEIEKQGGDNAAKSHFYAFRAAFSPKGNLLAAAEHKVKKRADPVHIALIDPDTGTTTQVLTFPSEGSVMLAPPRFSIEDGTQALAFSPDGRLLAAGTTSGKVHLFDLDSNPPKRSTWHTTARSVLELTFSGDGLTLFTLNEDHIVRHWVIDRGIPAQPTYTYGDKNTGVNCLQRVPKHATSGNPECLLVDSLTGPAFLRIANLNQIGSIGNSGAGNGAASPDGRTVAGIHRSSIVMMDRCSGRTVQVLQTADTDDSTSIAINCLCFSPDGSLLVSNSTDSNHVRLWEVSSGRLLGDAFVPGPDRITFRPDGKMFVVTGRDQLYRFEISSFGEQSYVAITPFSLRCFGIDSNSPRLAAISTMDPIILHSEIAVWNYNETAVQPLSHLLITCNPHELSPPLFTTTEPTRIIYGQKDEIYIWRYLDKDDRYRQGHNDHLGKLEDWNFIDFRSPEELWLTENTQRKRLLSWKLTEAKPTEVWNNKARHGDKGISNFTALKIGSRYTLVGLRDGGIALLDSRSRKFLRYLEVCSNRIRSLAFAPDETWCLAGDESGKIYRISLPDGRIDEPFAPHRDSVVELALIGDLLIVSGSADRTIKFWRPDGTLLFTLPFERPVSQLRVSPDGKQLLVLLRDERAIRVWHLDRLEQRFAELGVDLKLTP